MTLPSEIQHLVPVIISVVLIVAVVLFFVWLEDRR